MVFIVPTGLYICFSTPAIQNIIREEAQSGISNLIGAPLKIEKIRIRPFSRIDLQNITILNPTDYSDTIASIETISSRFELKYFIRTGRIIIDYALLEKPILRLSRASLDSPLNIKPIIDSLNKGKGPQKETSFELRISNIALLDGELSYDIFSEPSCQPGKFCPYHIKLSDIELNAYIPKLSNNSFDIDLDHLSFREAGGFELRTLKAEFLANSEEANLKDVTIQTSGSKISFEPITLNWKNFKNATEALNFSKISISTKGPAILRLSDFSEFIPTLSSIENNYSLHLNMSGNLQNIFLSDFQLNDISNANNLSLSVKGNFSFPKDSLQLPQIELSSFELYTSPEKIFPYFSKFVPTPQMRHIASSAGFVDLKISGKLSHDGFFESSALLHGKYLGQMELNAQGQVSPKFQSVKSNLSAHFENLNLSLLSGNTDLGSLCASSSIVSDWSKGQSLPHIDASMDVSSFLFKNNNLSNIQISFLLNKDRTGEITLLSDNKTLAASIQSEFCLNPKYIPSALYTKGDILSFRPEGLGLNGFPEGSDISLKTFVDLEGEDLDDISGRVLLENIKWTTSDNKALTLNNLEIISAPEDSVPHLIISSDIVNGKIEGNYSFSSLVPEIKNLISRALPSLISSTEIAPKNNFSFEFRIDKARDIADFFNLPVVPVYPIDINGFVHSISSLAEINLQAPYLLQGSKLIQHTSLKGIIDGNSGGVSANINTDFPTKKGLMSLKVNTNGTKDIVNTLVDWSIQRAIPIEGIIDFSTALSRNIDKSLMVSLQMNPGSITFGEDLWQIRPSKVDFSNGIIDIYNFKLETDTQKIAINGKVGPDSEDTVKLDIHNVSLLPIFETLEIDNALLSGNATGTFTASQVLSENPIVSCPDLKVKSIGYNRCTLGDAVVEAGWNNSKKSFYLDADIVEPELNLKSHIWGDIYPLSESLDINFDANHVKVGFMQPFMSAFSSEVTGHASGNARLFGTFKEIDMTGKIFAENVGIQIDITNTKYFATDTVYLTPGLITIPNITVRDRDNSTAKLWGELKHTFFKAPVFDFRLTDARDFLCFNGTPKQNPDWYGTVFCNGSATIQGHPGVVDINVNMATTSRSVFTFVLSDRLDAEEYSFITFRDITPASEEDSLNSSVVLPDDVQKILNGDISHNEDEASAYNMDILVDINPETKIVLVMDPAGGDEIQAYGVGNMRMAYHSEDNSLNIWGNYTLDRGSYNFTLQDIIIKDFTIKPGSTITFNGNPYAAEANIQAYYAVNANLSDLDESFLQDKELNRTNVPVHALLKLTGDIRQPDIDFDLEFPTLTSDTYRKVRSIVSTSDMMNRQIIYLLALNRFYTPDYMASTTKGSELFSVASSTISSQLSSMLGKLSENWSIAPNLRSDNGDFSDVEVDVALSSRLLNNRLLLNGNFGYRDKSLNTNRFIGDFDVEYLLNKKGSWRLKAYNRYNDQNYYLRTANTTQGVGIMFRKDFDNLFGKSKDKTPTPHDSISEPLDSILIQHAELK